MASNKNNVKQFESRFKKYKKKVASDKRHKLI